MGGASQCWVTKCSPNLRCYGGGVEKEGEENHTKDTLPKRFVLPELATMFPSPLKNFLCVSFILEMEGKVVSPPTRQENA